MSTAVVLGAGFSKVAGLPAVYELLEEGVLPKMRPGEDSENMEGVLARYRLWRSAYPADPVDVWLSGLWEAAEADGDGSAADRAWCSTTGFLLRRLAPVREPVIAPYYHGVTDYKACDTHRLFWKQMLNRELNCVVSLNYDILAEQALHEPDGPGKTRPIFHYGGFSFPQYVRQMVNITEKDPEKNARIRALGIRLPLYKLHGSANWAWDEHTPTLKIYDDVRAAYRSTRRAGSPAVIPPIREEQLPEEFAQVWRGARLGLGSAEQWVVCGYSLPDYDVAVRELLVESLCLSSVKHIQIIDPNSAALKDKWLSLADQAGIEAAIEPLPGLPQAFVESSTGATPAGRT